jgi:DNA-directed RNA polymerase specialized sigma24 family protein
MNTHDSLTTATIAIDPTEPRDAAGTSNDNAAAVATADTTYMLAERQVTRYIAGTLRRYGVDRQEMPDAIADVQVDALEAARRGPMPASMGEWKALASTIAMRQRINAFEEAKVRAKYDLGLCEDPDRYDGPTLQWEHRDPVDTKRYLVVLKELFDSGQMPEDGQEILQGEADEVPHGELAEELGVTQTIVDNRLYRMRVRFRTRLAALGMLMLILLVSILVETMFAGAISVGAPQPEPRDRLDGGVGWIVAPDEQAPERVA